MHRECSRALVRSGTQLVQDAKGPSGDVTRDFGTRMIVSLKRQLHAERGTS